MISRSGRLRTPAGKGWHMPRGWILALAAALGLMALGLWLGEATQVLMNAASVCLACMGIG